jgi:IstB-like ATP binding protein
MRSTRAPVTRVGPWKSSENGGVGPQLHITILAALNRPVEDWATLLGDVVVVTPLLDRLMHHGHLLKFEGKSWRLKESAARLAKQHADA